MSEASKACWLLIWQQPTDRALAGWCPELSVRAVSGWPKADAVSWITEQIEGEDS